MEDTERVVNPGIGVRCRFHGDLHREGRILCAVNFSSHLLPSLVCNWCLMFCVAFRVLNLGLAELSLYKYKSSQEGLLIKPLNTAV